jgi:hypothetical protein
MLDIFSFDQKITKRHEYESICYSWGSRQISNWFQHSHPHPYSTPATQYVHPLTLLVSASNGWRAEFVLCRINGSKRGKLLSV